MVKKKRTPRVSREEWLAKALEVFRREGEPGVRIEVLAREIGVAKAGFYWHFKDREDLLNQVLNYWAHEYTEVVTENEALLSLPPRERLLNTMEMIYDHDLPSLDLPFRTWALKDKQVRRAVQKVIRKRLEFTRQIFNELGFKGEDAEARTRMFVASEANDRSMFTCENKQQARVFREYRLKAFLSGSNDG